MRYKEKDLMQMAVNMQMKGYVKAADMMRALIRENKRLKEELNKQKEEQI